jgi:hypothetical protein
MCIGTPLRSWTWKGTGASCWRRSWRPGESIFETRAVAAEIGWIETCLPAVAARAIRAVEDLLSDGHAEGSESIYHQLRAFEAFEYGLLATWETPDGLVCVPRHV